MNKITKDNLQKFIKYYHGFHDSYITNINYDISKSKIELLIDVYWSGEPILKEDNTYQTNKTKMRIFFYQIEKYNNKEISSSDYIDEALIKYIRLNNKELLYFTIDEEEPHIYIVCESIEYEEIKESN